MIEIRDATPDDIPAIARAHVEADRETYSALFGPRAYALEPAESELRWRTALRDGDTLLVASCGDDIVGLGHARGNRIEALYLRRAYQRRGTGSALLRGLLAALNREGIPEARLDVVTANENAIAFYRAHGACPVGRRINRDARGDSDDLVLAISTAAHRPE